MVVFIQKKKQLLYGTHGMLYDYRCPECKGIWELSRPVEERDNPYVCSMCQKECSRLISKASFVINGYSFKNGYSDHIGNMMPKSMHGRKYK